MVDLKQIVVSLRNTAMHVLLQISHLTLSTWKSSVSSEHFQLLEFPKKLVSDLTGFFMRIQTGRYGGKRGSEMEIEKDHQLPHLKSTHQKKEAESAMQIYFSARLQSVKVSAASRVVFSGVHCQCSQLCNLIVTTVTQPPLTPACSRAHYAVVAFQQLQAKRQIAHCANMPLCRIYAASCITFQLKCHHCCLVFTRTRKSLQKNWSA